MVSSVYNTETFRRLEDIAQSLIDWDEDIRCRHFSFIIHKKRIVSIGINQKKTHPTNLKNRKISLATGIDFSDQKHTCSEFSAILKLKNLTNIDTKRCTLVNIRYDRNRKTNLAAPCMSCKNLLRYFQFKNVIWTDNNGKYTS